MKLSPAKPSKKTMRVATIFTGVAAAAVGMTTQAANAQDAAHPTVRPTSRHIARTARPAVVTSGSIRHAYSCLNPYTGRNVDTTWVHVVTNVYLSPIEPTTLVDCYGGKGTSQSPRGHGVIGECGGNNHGFMTGTNSGNFWVFDFGPGSAYAWLSKTSLYDITIEGWTGTKACKASKL